ncbi:hypothetical protein TNCV_272611 [Trichonephila clavipes]|nr:hypothetical protein TNCV_272611 [Trichonephila clavipes]
MILVQDTLAANSDLSQQRQEKTRNTCERHFLLGEIPEAEGLMSPEPVRLVGLLYARWRPHLPPHPQFRHETGREVNILRSPAPAVSAATTHKKRLHTIILTGNIGSVVK